MDDNVVLLSGEFKENGGCGKDIFFGWDWVIDGEEEVCWRYFVCVGWNWCFE